MSRNWLLLLCVGVLVSCASRNQGKFNHTVLFVDETALYLFDDGANEAACGGDVATLKKDVQWGCVQHAFDSLVEKYPLGGDSLSCRLVFRIESDVGVVLRGYIDGRVVESEGARRKIFLFDNVPKLAKKIHNDCVITGSFDSRRE